jgi:tetratricopeptide (TPR) repeat protein
MSIKVQACLLLLFCFIFHSNTAQGNAAIRSLEKVKEEDLIASAFRVFHSEIEYADSATAFGLFNEMTQVNKELNSCKLNVCITFLKGRYLFKKDFNGRLKSTACLQFFDAILNGEHCSDIIYTEAMFFKGYALIRTPGYSKGFEYIMRAKEMAQEIGFAKFPNTFELYALLGNTLYSFSDYENALVYLLEGVKFHSTVEAREAVDAYNTIALCYRQSKNYDSASYYFQYAYNLANSAKVADWIGIVSGNIGEMLYRKGKYREALSYLYRDIQISSATQQIGSTARAYLTVGKIYILTRNLDSASLVMRAAAPLVFATNDNKVFADYYSNLYNINKTGNKDRAIVCNDSSLYYRELAAREIDIIAADRIKSKLEMEKFTGNIRLLESENRRSRLQRTGVIIIAILVLLICMQIIRRNRLQKLHTKKELANAQLMLNTYVESLKQNNKLLEETKLELETLSRHDEPLYDTDRNEEILQQLQQSTILTEDHWKDFKKHFSSIHTQFFAHLEQHFPGLTNAETRLLALSKIGLSVNEKASALGISPDSVRKTKLRLYKKLGITEEEIFQRLD